MTRACYSFSKMGAGVSSTNPPYVVKDNASIDDIKNDVKDLEEVIGKRHQHLAGGIADVYEVLEGRSRFEYLVEIGRVLSLDDDTRVYFCNTSSEPEEAVRFLASRIQTHSVVWYYDYVASKTVVCISCGTALGPSSATSVRLSYSTCSQSTPGLPVNAGSLAQDSDLVQVVKVYLNITGVSTASYHESMEPLAQMLRTVLVLCAEEGECPTGAVGEVCIRASDCAGDTGDDNVERQSQ